MNVEEDASNENCNRFVRSVEYAHDNWRGGEKDPVLQQNADRTTRRTPVVDAQSSTRNVDAPRRIVAGGLQVADAVREIAV